MQYLLVWKNSLTLRKISALKVCYRFFRAPDLKGMIRLLCFRIALLGNFFSVKNSGFGSSDFSKVAIYEEIEDAEC